MKGAGQELAMHLEKVAYGRVCRAADRLSLTLQERTRRGSGRLETVDLYEIVKKL